jgi:hypothetical protein
MILLLLAACGLPKEVAAGSPRAGCAVAIDAERVHAAVRHLARSPRRSLPRRTETREWLRAELAAAGFASEELPFSIAGVDGTNLVARGPGARVLVGAHYDTVQGSPGADDNASGVAAVLELARVLGPSAPVTWAWFDAEEPHDAEVGSDGRNFAFGSQAFVDREPDWDLAVIVESVGYRCEGDCQQVPPLVPRSLADGTAIYWVANPSARWADLAATFDAAAAPTRSRPFTLANRGRTVRESRFSDHAPFWDRGIDAVMVTDTAPLRNPHYHRDSDREVDPAFLADVTRGLAAAIRAATGTCATEP